MHSAILVAKMPDDRYGGRQEWQSFLATIELFRSGSPLRNMPKFVPPHYQR